MQILTENCFRKQKAAPCTPLDLNWGFVLTPTIDSPLSCYAKPEMRLSLHRLSNDKIGRLRHLLLLLLSFRTVN